MTKKPRSRGLPKTMQAAIDREDEEQREAPKETLEQFVQEMHASSIPDEAGREWPTKEWLQGQFQTKSAIIRYLINQGYEVKDIARTYGYKYQHVRNVSVNPLKRGPNEDWRKPLLENTDIPNPKDFKPVND